MTITEQKTLPFSENESESTSNSAIEQPKSTSTPLEGASKRIQQQNVVAQVHRNPAPKTNLPLTQNGPTVSGDNVLTAKELSNRRAKAKARFLLNRDLSSDSSQQQEKSRSDACLVANDASNTDNDDDVFQSVNESQGFFFCAPVRRVVSAPGLISLDIFNPPIVDTPKRKSTRVKSNILFI